MKLQHTTSLKGTIRVPGDKSISHRAVMFGSLAKGKTRVYGFLQGADCLATMRCFQNLGIRIEKKISLQNDAEPYIEIEGRGLFGLHQSPLPLDVGNSGTTTRLAAGILCGQPFSSVLYGDASLNSRPMKRIMDPLTQMGADITSTAGNNCAPLMIRPASLHGIHYDSPVASAQVKSSVLLAGMYANGSTTVTEPTLSRDHTERMLSAFGASLSISPSSSDDSQSAERPAVTIEPLHELYGCDVPVPGDISSAAYWIAAALLVPGSEITLRHVGINPTRAGILEVCRMMGASLRIENIRDAGAEPVADITVSSSSLHGTTIGGSLIPALIDELPMIAVMAACADGVTTIRDAAELRVKETDRIETICRNLQAMGCSVTPTDDGMVIQGGRPLRGAAIDPKWDHRIAMAFSIAALTASSETVILDDSCVEVSYPGFYETLKELARS